MKKSSILSSFVIFCFCLIGGAGVYAFPQAEVVDGPRFDFGEVQANQKLHHEFILKNVGDTTLNIEKLKSG
ncbi:DUF1573 domain-containing protein [candidate division KSB3 bacterium]|jgi:hypothetical protein|uniref:DUF1573 domain-containing protein n=1 Tax=candidate division KSB3 bacterium TaxID=2044937 RepID=A0A9D5JV68_9BACT|nr:DUF1573 domain-containing protein [candidate division KSB3 bacterium]MBD3324878.1 DUF1573 domain-containing protein [candidate division KSB3 bacterium]